MFTYENILLLCIGLTAIFLMTQRWFWIAAFGLSGLYCALYSIASVIHFQILLAILSLFAALLLLGVAIVILEKAY